MFAHVVLTKTSQHFVLCFGGHHFGGQRLCEMLMISSPSLSGLLDLPVDLWVSSLGKFKGVGYKRISRVR